MRFSQRVEQLIHSPIGAAHALVGIRTNERPLLDLSQAAPSFPPADAVMERIAETALETDAGRYPASTWPSPVERICCERLKCWIRSQHRTFRCIDYRRLQPGLLLRNKRFN